MQDFSAVTVPLLGFTIAVVTVLVLIVLIVFAARRISGTHTPQSVTATLTLCLQYGLWTLIVPVAWEGLFALVPEGGAQAWMTQAFGDAAASNGLQWVLALGVMLSFAYVTVLRSVQARGAQRRVDDSTDPRAAARSVQPADRLILHPVIATALVLAVLAGAAIVMVGTVKPAWIKPVQELASRVGNLKPAAAAVVLFPLLAAQLRLALDLAHDVMFYLYYATEPGRRLLSRSRGTTRSNNPMRSRFHAVVNHLVREQHVAHIVVLAHSQGTVIALDEFDALVGHPA